MKTFNWTVDLMQTAIQEKENINLFSFIDTFKNERVNEIRKNKTRI